MGYIYLITNKLNGMKYVGQTSRDIDTRFAEHCSETRGHSKLHNAIQKYGWTNFKVEELEEVPLDQLDEKEQYWIKKLDTYNNGYNLTLGGSNVNINISHIPAIRVKENGIIIASKEELSRLISSVTSWSTKYISVLLKRAIEEDRDFLGYHFERVKLESLDYLSDENVIIDWIKTLNIRYVGKHVHCFELEKDFDSITEAARYLLDNKLYETKSKTPIQSIITSINQNLNGKSEYIKGVNGNLTFVYVPGSTKLTGSKTPFSKSKVYCPQINKTFESQVEAARYMVNNGIWTGIKEKTAKLRISDIIRGSFPDYKGYTFYKVD